MIRLLKSIASFFVFSRTRRIVRKPFIFVVTNFFAIAALVFSAEVIIIILGIRGISLPFDHKMLNMLTGLFF